MDTPSILSAIQQGFSVLLVTSRSAVLAHETGSILATVGPAAPVAAVVDLRGARDWLVQWTGGRTDRTYSTAELAKLSETPATTIISWAEDGVIAPERRDGRYYYRFADALGIMVAASLRRKGIPPRVTRGVARYISGPITIPESARPIPEILAAPQGRIIVTLHSPHGSDAQRLRYIGVTHATRRPGFPGN